jgi:hypothetical protein
MIVNDLLRAWEEGVAEVASPALNRRDEVSQADLGQHATALRVKTHVQTGQGTYGVSWGKGCDRPPTASWNKGCGGVQLTAGPIC